jgi:hypothetical protein
MWQMVRGIAWENRPPIIRETDYPAAR